MIVINIYLYDTSASKRGPLKTIEITEENLIRVIDESIKS